jgi:phosphotransferase system enzyme I (PtsI)
MGIGVSPGVVAGPVMRLRELPALPESQATIVDVDTEVAAASHALEAVATDLDVRAGKAGSEAAGVLEALALMLRDPVLGEQVALRIKEGRSAPRAVSEAFETFRSELAMAGPYLAERVADLDDLRDRTVAVLLDLPMPGIPNPGHPFVLVARDLSPADTAVLDTSIVLAIVTELGGPTSHTAIIAKSLGLPAIVACPAIGSVADGEMVQVDGSGGSVVVSPSAAPIIARRPVISDLSGPGRTADGKPIQLMVNVGGHRDLATAVAADSEGVGLFRTEFLFLDRTDAPGFDEQLLAYQRVFDGFAGRKVVVRTIDAGADKPLPFATLPDEPNPALGMRGLRTARRFPELLSTQLRAIAAAAQTSEAKVWVMAPMVSTAAEAAEFTGQAHDLGLAIAGVMIEIPAAALRAPSVLAVADFASLGTNDLSQYTFAADRMAGDLAELLDPWQPALLELVRLTAEAGRALGKPVGVCGEAASDAGLALVLAGLGVTSLSMAPICLGAVRSSLAGCTEATCQGLAALALAAPDGRSARALVRRAAGLA